MSKFKIVLGKSESDRRNKRYMSITDENGNVTYHNFKEKVHRWSTKYGPYNTIKRKGGEARFYNIGKQPHLVVISKELDINIDSKSVALGYNY